MVNEQDTPTVATGQWRISGALAAALGAVVLSGWYTGTATIIQVHPSFVPMQYNTALCFLLCGVGVLSFDRRPRLAAITASLAALTGLLTLGEYFFGVELGLDQLFMRHYITVETSHPGRMAPNTALCFTITGVILLVAAGTKGRAVRTIGVLALLVVILGCVALIGYPSALKSSYGWGGLTSMAVHTAFGFVTLGVGLFAAAWAHGLSEHSTTAVASLFGAGAAITLWHVTTLQFALEHAMIGRAEGEMLKRGMHGTVALVAFTGILGTVAVGLVTKKHVLLALVDIRQRKHAEQRYRVLFESSRDAIMTLAPPSWRFTSGNPATVRMFAVKDEGEFVSLGPWDLAPKMQPDGRRSDEKAGEMIETAMREGSHFFEWTHKQFGGPEFPATVLLTRVVLGGQTLLQATVRDITAQKRVENELAKAKEAAEAGNRVKSEFLANMSHEIRTPMTAILGFSDVLMGTEMNQEQLDAATTIKQNGEYLIGIINDILDLSKIEAGKLEVEHIQCQPQQILSDVVSLMRVRADAKNLPLEIEYDGPIPQTIQSDPTRLRQILINLTGNAVKFTEVGKVRLVARLLDAESDEPKMQFEVIDSGMGMTQQQIAKLFKPFHQADTSTTRNFGGTGLGLAISKRLAEKLGGDITVQSTLGEGTTFIVTVGIGRLRGVKLLDDPTQARASTDPDKKPTAPTTKLDCRVLLAEDGPDNQRLIAFLLKKAGAEVDVAENGQIAYDLALAARDRQTPFDVILMDMQMPVMDGYDATVRLREAGYAGPIIALTAHAMTADRDKCLKAGCDDYATKPLDREKLLSMVARYASPQGIPKADDAPVA